MERSDSPGTRETRGSSAIAAVEQAMMQVSWLGQRHLMQLLDSEQFRLTLPQFYTLLYLRKLTEGCKMSALADATQQSAASLTGVIDRLLEKQLVARTRHNRDRRQVMVVLTSRGDDLIAAIQAARTTQMQAALTDLSRQDIDMLLSLLDRVINGMRRVTEPDDSVMLSKS